MAIVSLVALFCALAIGALATWQPWATSSVAPRLSVAPDLGVALDDAVAVVPGRQLAVSAARTAGPGEPNFVAGGVARGEGSTGSALGIAPGRPVARPVGGVPAAGVPAPPSSEPLPAPQPAPVPVATPVSAPAPSSSPEPAVVPPVRSGPGSRPGKPGSAGGPGPVGGVVSGPVEVYEGDEYAYSFSFYIEPSAYRAPGEGNSILRFWDEASGSESFGLQLWDDGGGAQRGLWASGDAMGGERFLAPVAEGVWHQLVVTFEASSEGDGLYLLLLDGEPIDARAWVSLIEPTSGFGLLEAALFRDGERVEGAPEIFFGPARLGETVESVIP